jgi:hypothetical protein
VTSDHQPTGLRRLRVHSRLGHSAGD